MADEKKTYLVNIESNLAKYAEEAAEAKKKVDELAASNKALKESGTASAAEIEANNAALRNAQKEYSQAKKMVDLQTAANKSEAGSRKQLGEILNLQMQALGKLDNAYITNAKGVRTLNPLYIEQRKRIAETKQAIIDYDLALNDGRSNIGRYGESIKSAMGQAGGAVSQLSSSVGGAIGDIGNSISAFLSGGLLGALAAAIGIIAKAWKTTQENIELYLESADKVAAGIGAYEAEAEKAREDARKRAEGQFAEGLRLSGEYTGYLLRQKDLTDEQKAYYNGMIETGKQMMINGRQIITDTTGIKNKIEWERKYNALIVEKGKLDNERVLREKVEWKELEVKLKTQRAIVSDELSTEAQKKQAGIDAKIIAQQIVNSKTEYYARELVNLQAIADMTGKQKVYEDQLVTLAGKKAELQLEYLGDKMTGDKLERAAAKDEKTRVKDAEDAIEKATKVRIDLAEAANNKELSLIKKRHVDGITSEVQYQAELLMQEVSFLNKKLTLYKIGSKEYEDIQVQIQNIAIKSTDDKVKKQIEIEKKLWDFYEKGWKKEDEALKDKKKWYKDYEDWYLDQLDKQAEKEKKAADKKKDDEEKLRDLQFQVASQAINGIFDLNSAKRDEEMNALGREEDIKLSNKNLTEAQKLKIEEEYAKKVSAIKTKQAKADKVQALFNIGIDTAKGSMKAVSESPLTFGLPFLPWVIAMGLLQAAFVAAQPIPGGGGGGGGSSSIPTSISASAPAQRTFAQSAGSTIFTQPQLSQTQLNALPQQGLLTAADIAAALSKLPAPIVTVEDINAKTAEVKKVSVRATI